MLYIVGWIDRIKPVDSEDAYRAKCVEIREDVSTTRILSIAATQLKILTQDIVLCVPVEGYSHLHDQVLVCNGE